MSDLLPFTTTTFALHRAAVVAAIAGRMADYEWAFQGAPDAAARWAAAEDNGDLDVWVHPESAEAMTAVLRGLGGTLLCRADAPSRLCHDQWWIPTRGTNRDGAIVDVTIGDLRVGGVLLAPTTLIETIIAPVELAGSAVLGRRFTGLAGVADLALRPLLRGRLVHGERLAVARAVYSFLVDHEHSYVKSTAARVVGDRHAAELLAWLGGDELAGDPLVRLARRQMVIGALRTSPTTWQQRRTILPGGARPLGLRTDGVVVALVGTDGAGKSTVADGVQRRLERAGVTVERRYFGMARGNARWLTALRDLAGGGSVEVDLQSGRDGDPKPPSRVMRMAAYAYAVDYVWRAWRTVGPARRRGAVVLCDRWITDLHRHPAPGSPAARVAEWFVGHPQVFVLADAPVDQIVARKPERTPEAAAAEQAGLRALGEVMYGRRARGGGRTVFHIADTSGAKGTAEAALVDRIVADLHRRLH